MFPELTSTTERQIFLYSRSVGRVEVREGVEIGIGALGHKLKWGFRQESNTSVSSAMSVRKVKTDEYRTVCHCPRFCAFDMFALHAADGGLTRAIAYYTS